jgi:DNA-binding beta-propeller fold protein YncE
MRTRSVLAWFLVAASACATAQRAAPRVRPLRGAEGEVIVYLQPLPRELERVSFRIESVALRRQDGGEVPLVIEHQAVSAADAGAQRRLAWGRVPPGDYVGLLVKVGSATLARDGERSRLLVPAEPVQLDVHLTIDRGTARVLWASLKPEQAVSADYNFSPGFTVTVAAQTPPQIALYCTDAASAAVTVIDRRVRLATGEVPVGDLPRGIVLDRAATRAYVALGAEDQIQVLDVAANASIERIRLSPGDGPRELGLAVDGTLVSVNERSRTVSFIDVAAKAELGRVGVGDAPVALLLDRSGPRAYVVNRASATISVIDVPRRVVVATLGTDPEPVRAQLSRDGSRLYVAHRGSAYLTVFALPALTQQVRAYVGLGATTLKIDSRTDFLYLSLGGERRISVYDPVSIQLVDSFDVPGTPSYMAIDDTDNTLHVVVPERRAIAVFDLTSRKLLAELPVGEDPYSIAMFGERF